MLRAASIGQKPFAKDGFIRHLPLFLSEHDGVPQPAGHRRRCRSATSIKKIEQPSAAEKAAFYAGCLIDFAYPEMGEAVVKVLNKAGIEVVFPEGQTCCGAPARYSGAYEVAAQNAKDNIEALLARGCELRGLRLPHLHRRAEARLHRTFESLGMTDALPRGPQLWRPRSWTSPPWSGSWWTKAGLTSRTASSLGKFTYHDSCHLKRTLRRRPDAAQAAAAGRLRAHGDVRVRHVLRHGRLLLPQAAGALGADPGAQAGEHQEDRRAPGAHRLSRAA